MHCIIQVQCGLGRAVSLKLAAPVHQLQLCNKSKIEAVAAVSKIYIVANAIHVDREGPRINLAINQVHH
jgi:hypothetical protein